MARYNRREDLGDIIKALEERIRVLERNTRMASTEASPGGGTSTVWYADDGITKIFEIGTQPVGDRGLVMYRDDGTEAVRVSRALAGDVAQTVQISDRNGNVIFQDGWFGGQGINHPKIPVNFYPVNTVLDVSTSAGTATNMFQARLQQINPKVKISVLANVNTGGVTGTLQLYDSFFGLYGSTYDVTSTTPVEVVITEDSIPFGGFQDERDVYITGKISVGAGTLTVRLIRARGE